MIDKHSLKILKYINKNGVIKRKTLDDNFGKTKVTTDSLSLLNNLYYIRSQGTFPYDIENDRYTLCNSNYEITLRGKAFLDNYKSQKINQIITILTFLVSVTGIILQICLK